MKEKLTAIDLFAGAGGFSLAALQCGFDVLAAIEYDHAATNTYEKSIKNTFGSKNTKVYNTDINLIDPNRFMMEVGIAPRGLDLLLGGPPCQGFSTHRINDAGVDDPRNSLLLKYYEFVHALQPKIFLIENVAGLLWKRHETYLATLKQNAEKNGYTIHFCGLLNARDYGVPQSRKRVFILGVRNDLSLEQIEFPPKPTHFSPESKFGQAWKTASCVFEKPSKKILNRYWPEYFSIKTKLSKKEVDNLLESLEFGVKLDDNDPLNFNMGHTDGMVDVLHSTPLNGSRADSNRVLPCHKDHDGHKDVYGRIMIHLPSNTITTGCINPSKGRFVHPWENHGISMRHAARLQTFPDKFIFYGNATQQAKQIGNAVPVKLGESLITAIRSFLTVSK
ncbi:DNA cytosine methyltransferase [Aeromonas jandaei]|uniref:DNA cytosine methyltransferase n=1 Tax=Aeromonas jandaei TaxID=650 RepID=UPI001C5B31AF|nr:DNA cytosine methyltransferase [Aeromonas jandaei]MBW3761785.1 DNA cytosine methyltransferase [Aeromonas jandaei]